MMIFHASSILIILLALIVYLTILKKYLIRFKGLYFLEKINTKKNLMSEQIRKQYFPSKVLMFKLNYYILSIGAIELTFS